MRPALGHAASSPPAPGAADFTDHFSKLGFEPVAPMDMITGDAFNGGLRYDETRADQSSGNSLFVQPAARIDDAGGHDAPGVLALFTICGLRVSAPAEPGALFDTLLAYLVERRGLDPARLVFVSTDVFTPYSDRHEMVRAGRTLLRSREDAMAAGDGSGYFAPKDHPASPAFSTVSIHYPLPDGPASALAYPLKGYLEIAEISITPLDGSTAEFEVGGFGLERLAMAEGGAAPDFEGSRKALLSLIEDEAAKTGKALPPGYSLFSRS